MLAVRICTFLGLAIYELFFLLECMTDNMAMIFIIWRFDWADNGIKSLYWLKCSFWCMIMDAKNDAKHNDAVRSNGSNGSNGLTSISSIDMMQRMNVYVSDTLSFPLLTYLLVILSAHIDTCRSPGSVSKRSRGIQPR